ncbi:hypothetical protein NYE70_17950 [Paenibacillus sp. FSL R5-0407]|uniref:hypothetical protein n=1 Tax=Paenibacillus sp. FSL R5-0407 TaxID=2975320 RepID=UPI0030F8A614
MKWIGWLAKLVITVVTVSMLTVMTTGYVVNTYIQSLLGSYNLPIAGKAPTLGGMMKGMFGFGGDDKDKKEAEGGGTDVTSGIGDTDGTSATGGTGGSRGMDDSEGGSGRAGTGANGANNGTSGFEAGKGSEGTDGSTGVAGIPDGGQKDADAQTGGSGGEEAPEDALSVMGGISSNSGSSGSQEALGQDQQVVVTPDEMVAKKDELSDKDKEEVFAILMSKLPQAEMQKMTEAMEEGLTESEMIEIEQILSKYLDKTEYSKMMKILNS